MIYKDFQGKKLSAVGLGNMRLPVLEGDETRIDREKAEQMIDYALANGINYFDTAWGYHGGTSEPVIGGILKKHPRDSFYLATKFPGYDLSNFGKTEEIFEKQLERLQVDHFDFYLFHNVSEVNIAHYLDEEKYGTAAFLTEQKQKGRIKHLGFSCHGNMDVMRSFLDRYKDIIEFCQIQLNWVDWDFQNAKEKVALLNEMNIPIWVMEPVRGGKLAVLPDDVQKELEELMPGRSGPEWCFRYLQSIPGVTMILSGMSDMRQIEENIRIFETEEPLTKDLIDGLQNIAKEMVARVSLPCTACRYCTSGCPVELPIPELIDAYNEDVFTGYGFRLPNYIRALPEGHGPADCVGCGSCEAVCPQGIKISAAMEDMVKRVADNPRF